MVAYYPTTMTAEKALLGALGLPLGLVPMGRIFWVDASNAAALDAPLLGKGEIDKPFATIAYAVSRCQANRGDVVMVKRGHYEAIATSQSWDCDGVTIYGEGPTAGKVSSAASSGRPMLEVTANTSAAAITLAGDAMRLHGIDVQVDASLAHEVVTLSGAGCVLTDVNIYPYASADSHRGVQINGDDGIIAGCLITQQISGSAVSTCISFGDTILRPIVVRNRIAARSSNAAFSIATGSAPVDAQIIGNRIEQYNGSVAIAALSGATGVFAKNAIYHADNTTSIDTLIGALGSMGAVRNYMMNANGEAGGIVPATVSA